MNVSYEHKVVLVTGAAAGIGRAIAMAAGYAGAKLILGDVDETGLRETAALLDRQGSASIWSACDVRSQADIDGLFAKGAQKFGHPDIVFANAGILPPPCNLWDMEEADFARVMDINATGCFRTLKAALPKMVARKSGSIVATASVAGVVGSSGVGAYVASKHAVVGLVRTAALNVATQGVRVNAICPGMVDTGMLDRLAAANPGIREALMTLNPMQRLATADEVANAAIWLASDQSTYVTGICLSIDGGFVAQ